MYNTYWMKLIKHTLVQKICYDFRWSALYMVREVLESKVFAMIFIKGPLSFWLLRARGVVLAMVVVLWIHHVGGKLEVGDHQFHGDGASTLTTWQIYTKLHTYFHTCPILFSLITWGFHFEKITSFAHIFVVDLEDCVALCGWWSHFFSRIVIKYKMF
jgi:hypothetical protein